MKIRRNDDMQLKYFEILGGKGCLICWYLIHFQAEIDTIDNNPF